jgi:hypothetical protein
MKVYVRSLCVGLCAAAVVITVLDASLRTAQEVAAPLHRLDEGRAILAPRSACIDLPRRRSYL